MPNVELKTRGDATRVVEPVAIEVLTPGIGVRLTVLLRFPPSKVGAEYLLLRRIEHYE